MEDQPPIPPRNGEGDHAKRGGGVFRATPEAIKRAREERRSGNFPEVVLWRVLRTRPGGFKFRRQHPLDCYRLDFACLQVRLAVEIDGEIHAYKIRRDAARDGRIAAFGFRTIRIPARDVLGNIEGVIQMIVTACRAGRPLHHPSDGPPPRTGEVF